MKKAKVSTVLSIAAVAVLSLASCQKSEITPVGVGSSSALEEQNKSELANVARTPYDEGFRSITSLTSGVGAKIGYVQLLNTTYTNQGSLARNFDLGGDAISSTSPLCYGAGVYNGNAIEAVVYNGADGYARISVATGIATNAASGNTSVGGSGIPLMLNGNLTTMRFEEIEVNPADGQVYGIVKGSSVNLYRIATDGSGTVVNIPYITTSGTTAPLFGNCLGNGYKSGSIAFVETPAASGNYELAFTSESQVYASLGIVVWRFQMQANSTVKISPVSSSRNYNTTVIPSSTAKINTASKNGELFFARDNGSMYQLNSSANNSVTPIAISPSNIANSNDFGYYKAY